MSHPYRLSEEKMLQLHDELLNYATIFGGKNSFLTFLEFIRSTKPHPLISAYRDFEANGIVVKWAKVIFKDKLELLLKLRVNESKQDNLLPDSSQKCFKKALNLVKTLRPIVFTFESKEGVSFTIEPFIVYSDSKTKLNPIFDAIFFLSLDSVKNILNYKPSAS